MKTLVFEFLNISKHRIIDKERELLKKCIWSKCVYKGFSFEETHSLI